MIKCVCILLICTSFGCARKFRRGYCDPSSRVKRTQYLDTGCGKWHPVSDLWRAERYGKE